ncbi:hypothetical protein PENSPDRAFT_735186 [Peniophora sp. CONT]|nr:hypothetical protein PENSPDRAFT_735186 [Peniophora sp. CONT]
MSMHPSNCDYFPYTTPGLDEKHPQAPAIDLPELTPNTSRPHASVSWRETRVLTLSILLIIVGVVGNALFLATGYYLVGALFGYGVLAPISELRVAHPTMALNTHREWCSVVMHALVMGLFTCTILLGALSGCMWITNDVWLGLKQLDDEARGIQDDEVFVDEKKLMLV